MLTPLPEALRSKLAEALAQHGQVPAAAALGCALGTLRRALRGGRVHSGTHAIVREYLSREGASPPLAA